MQELKYLDITSNKISEVGGLVIGELKNLNNLYLSHNKVTTKCVWKYLELEELKVLDVRFNSIGEEDKDGLRTNKKENLQLFL